jgi:MarR family 2-MHQ and catechol resistance regulon transcriptional repressor
MGKRGYFSNLSLSERVLISIVRAAENFKRTLSAIFRRHGLTFQKYNVLRVLETSENGRNSMSGVSRIMLVPGANITGIAKRLERNGFIIRKSDSNDERITLLEITPKGRKTLQNIESEKDRAISIILKPFSHHDQLELLAKIKQIIENTS